MQADGSTVSSVARGALLALEDFVGSHYGSLLRTAFLLTGDRHAAEDLLQEALAKSWRYAQRNNIEQPGAFIRRTLLNEYLSQRRRRSRVREEATEPGRVPHRLAQDVAAEFVARDAIWDALALLPPRQRAILVLRFYEDMSEAQIADVLGIGIGTVRSGAWRGLESLRKIVVLTMTEEDHA